MGMGFVLKAVTIVVAILVVIGGIVAMGSRNRRSNEGELNIRKINDDLEDHKEQLEESVLTRDAVKAKEKEKKKEDKEKAKAEKKRLKGLKDGMAAPETQRRVYVLDFDG